MGQFGVVAVSPRKSTSQKPGVGSQESEEELQPPESKCSAGPALWDLRLFASEAQSALSSEASRVSAES